MRKQQSHQIINSLEQSSIRWHHIIRAVVITLRWFDQFRDGRVAVGEHWNLARKEVDDFHRQVEARAAQVHADAEVGGGDHLRIVVNLEPFGLDSHSLGFFVELFKLGQELLFERARASHNKDYFRQL